MQASRSEFGAEAEAAMIDVAKASQNELDAAALANDARQKTNGSAVDLVVDGGNLPKVADDVRDLLASSGRLFDRGLPVRLVNPADGGVPSALPLSGERVVIETHRLCRPVKMNKDGNLVPVTLPTRIANLYLALDGEWMLPPLSGISSAPVLTADGGVRAGNGYDTATQLYCVGQALPNVPEQPSAFEAGNALALLRKFFRTFPFADAVRCREGNIEVVDLCHEPGQDESALLTLLMTAVCRPSLWLAPGALITSPEISGAGTGKGLLVRAICAIAFGIRPRAFTAGNDRHELDKRIAAELIEAHPVLFLDNVNGVALKSDVLASAITERPARARVLGQSRMVDLNSTAFIAVTGNGLSVSEDLARRFILVEMDARVEDPESRAFPPGFLDNIMAHRAELLAAVLTIWRWGRHYDAELTRGKPIGSFEQWAQWCRDPLLTLGCRDPIERIETVKARDPRRQRVAELFTVWWTHHADNPIKLSELDPEIKKIADPQDRGRQYIAAKIADLNGTRAAGFVMTRQESTGKWSAATYALKKIANTASDPIGHREHRDHGASPAAPIDPILPMLPMPYANGGASHPQNGVRNA